MSFEVRAIHDDEVEVFREAIVTTFGDDVESDPGGAARQRLMIPSAQAWAAYDAGAIVGSAATYDLAIGVPGGGTLPIAGLTLVSVRPSHRRRGILRALMKHHLDDARERGFAASGLWASEASIYGRFGYGIAAESESIEVQQAQALAVAAGRELDEVVMVDERRAREVLPAVYARATAGRPGALRRSELWWRERRFLEAPAFRGGASKRRHALALRGGEVTGYVAYRQRGGFSVGLPGGRAEIVELIGNDARADATLWRYALGLDLFPTVAWANAPIDDPLRWLVADARRVKRTRGDALWLRIDDVAAALRARQYDADGALHLAVEGEVWRLAIEGGSADVSRTTHAPDVELDRASLGALYLGGVTATCLARAGLARGTPAALRRADRAFASAIAPWCPEIF